MTQVRLHSLKLSGFKSFPDEVAITFPGNVSAIIGPNGCGKSNVVDAILWVLGEQSPSLLRLKQMGEVVFSGASGRAAAGTAEVTLTLKSSNGHWPESDGQLEIRRRVYRSGPSEYRLNGRTSRLKDVIDELITVGLGTRDYSIIEQGRVGQVLSGRPTDRRVLIEEAAGITRYKKRRHESELKLEHTRQNLIRLDDVISEVDRTLRQIKRQAGQARRHQRLRDELQEKIRRLLQLEAHQLDAARQELARQRVEIEDRVVAAAAALGGGEADLVDSRSALDAARTDVEAARSEVATLSTSKERLEAFLERSADLLDNLRSSLGRTRQESAALSSSRGGVDDGVAAATNRVLSLREALQKVDDTVAEAEQSSSDAKQRLEAAEGEAAAGRQELLRNISGLTASRNRLGELEREQDRLAYTLDQLEQEHERTVQRRDDVERKYHDAAKDSRTAAAAVDELEGRRHSLIGNREHLQQEANAARQEAEDLAQAAWELRHRVVGIERELARHAAAIEQLADCLPKDALAGQVSDYLTPAPEVAPLLDRVWHDWLELPVMRLHGLDSEQLEAVAELEGRIRLVVAAEATSPPENPTPEGAEPLVDLAGTSKSDLPWLMRALPAAYRCADAGRARALAEQYPTAVFIGPDDVVWRGRTMEPATAGSRLPGLLALRADLDRLRAESGDTQGRADDADGRRRAAAEQLQRLAGELAELDGQLVQAEQERARTTALEGALSEDRSRIERELEALVAELERSRTGRSELEERHGRLSDEVATMERRTVELERKVDDATAALDARREEAAEALRRCDRWQAESRLAGERVSAAAAEHDRMETEKAALMERLGALDGEQERIGGELERTEREVVKSRAQLAEEHGLLASSRQRERTLAERVEAETGGVEKLEQKVKNLRQAHEQVREELHAVDVEQTRLDGEWERLREVAAAELECGPEELASAELEGSDSVDELRGAVDELRLKIEKLGPVNLLALQEVDELQERSTFLSEQRADLVEALRKLDATIREIDAHCTERFVDTLEQVNGVFHETFTTLFGGGSACLQLVDDDDPLNSGIDITAQPPGKKTQSVVLLSGGEKALTALSLLISLFRIKPSPFCILDEVDAPLDDANVERLADLIQAMTDHTQFVLITHNRRTMARAESLYGITMEEPGVSKLVSVRLEE